MRPRQVLLVAVVRVLRRSVGRIGVFCRMWPILPGLCACGRRTTLVGNLRQSRCVSLGEILQQPVFSRDELRAAGLSDRTVSRRVKSGVFVRVGPGLLTTAGRQREIQVLNMAAHLRTELPLTGPSAASFFPKGPVLELVAHEKPWLIGNPQRRVGAIFVPHPSPEVVRREGILVASPRQAAMDALRVLEVDEGLDLVHRCVQQSLLKVADLDREARLLAGYSNVKILRDAADAVRTNAHSRSENRLHVLLRQAGIKDWTANMWITLNGDSYCIDIAFPARKLAIEYDSPVTHNSHKRFRADRKKWRALKRAGWTVLNYERESLGDNWPVTLEEIQFFLGCLPIGA